MGPLANLAAVLNGDGGSAWFKPDGTPAHYTRGLTMWWSESVAGYEQSPPSNRRAPIPPRARLADLARAT